MPIFDAKSRSWSAYVAGIGASGMLMASAFVMFVILVGVATFKTWPHPGNLLGLGAGNTVESDTESLGNSLGGSSSPGLGGVIGGLGRSLNSDLQSPAGN